MARYLSAFVVRHDGIVTDWDEGMQRLTGTGREAAVGRRCYDLAPLGDACGVTVCREGCPALRNAQCQSTGAQLQFTFPMGVDSPAPQAMMVVSAPSQEQGWCVVHLLTPVGPDPQSSAQAAPDILTPAETRVLGLLCQGLTTREISGRLRIRQATTRTHLRNILAKLKVHSRVEAVARMLSAPAGLAGGRARPD